MIQDPLIHAMGSKLLESSLQQQVLSQNIANAETPHYKAFRVVFDREMQGTQGASTLALTRTHAAHLPGRDALASVAGARLIRETGTTLRNDGNNVDLDRELADLAANQLFYSSISTLIRNRFAGYDRIITGRSG